VHIVAAKAVAFRESLAPEFAVYAAQVVANAKVLAEAMAPRVIAWSRAERIRT